MTIRMPAIGTVIGAFALCSCATTASPPSKSVATSVNCTEHTAGNIPANTPCMTPGQRSYSQTDIQRTGKSTVGDALALLDPALTVTH